MAIPITIPGKIKSVEQYTNLLREYHKGVEGLKLFFSKAPYPATIGFHFARPDKQEFNYLTLVNIVTKALCNLKIIPTTGCKTIMPVILPVEDKQGNPSWWTVDKKKQGVTMMIIKAKDIVAPDRNKSGPFIDEEDIAYDDTTTLKGGSILG